MKEIECRTFWDKMRKCLSIIKHKTYYTGSISYYPECEHKSISQILKDQMYNVWKYGFIEEYYFTYGFDRKEMTRKKMDTYIVPYRAFLNLINELKN